MSFEISEKDDCIKVIVKGPVELTSIKEFKENVTRLSETATKDVEFDLSNVTYIDSTGIGLLIMLNRRQKEREKKFRIINPSESVMSLLELSSLNEVLK